MEYDNDKTIFRYLKPSDNDMLSVISKDDIKDMLLYLDKYYLEYRDNLGLDIMDTFGIEIEIEHFKGWIDFSLNKFHLEVWKVVGNKNWDSRNDISLEQGREIVSEILNDEVNNWNKIKNVCNYVSKWGYIDKHCGAHVHSGAQILGENSIYWYRFFKLWSIYENIIYRFCYGEYCGYRPRIMKYSRPAAQFYNDRLKLLDEQMDYSLIEMLRIIEPRNVSEKYTKNFGVSYWRMLLDDNYDEYEDFNKINDGCTLELRVPNGTLDEVIWQNNINFFIKMMLYCKSDRFNNDILDRRKIQVEDIFSSLTDYSQIYLEQALEFCDLIFDNNLDKLYFLRQYLKDYQCRENVFVKSKKFTNKITSC